MKKLRIVLVIVFLVSIAPGYAQVKDKDMMVKKIFTVLQQKDETGFIGLFPDAATTREFVAKLYSKDTTSGIEAKRLLEELLNSITDSTMQIKLRESFASAIEHGERKGIEWSKTTFISHLADSSYDEEKEMSMLQGKIYFSTEKEKYFLSFGQTIWFANAGWYGVDINRIDELSKENEPEEFELPDDPVVRTVEMEMPRVDTTEAMMDSIVKARETKPVKKTVPKKPASKPAKTKSQTPARKPE